MTPEPRPHARPEANLYTALRAGFPASLSATAIETADSPEPLRYSWSDLERGSAMLANLLGSLALPRGSRVAVQVDKCVEALMLYLAVLRAGHVYLPLNTAYQEAEVAYFIGNAEPAVVVCSPRNFGWVSRLAFTAGTKHVYTLDDDRTGTLLDRAAHHADRQVPAAVEADDLAAILYTSGTTGRSKGAMLTHRNLLANAQVLHEAWGWAERAGRGTDGGDVLIHALPIFHVHGLFVAIHGALLSGSKMIWFGRFDPRATVARLPEATVFMGVPTLYVRMLGEAALTRAACAHMRLFVSGSAPLLIETFEQWRERTGHTILERYGMSETVMLTSNPYRPEGARRGGTVGPALPGVGVRVHDDKGRPLPTGEIGGIEVKGESVFKGYWRMPEKTADEFTTDLWFKTGDVGRIDADGYVTIVGRSKDLII
ncbi:MAG: AMP-binding protein, partial [Rubrivivax sp.]|nr:AMP-binding protein [Rubrivivax sp.]